MRWRPPLSSGINGTINALAYSDGILYAGGAFKSAGNAAAEDVAYWDGANWHSFGAKYRIFEVGDRGGEVGTYVNALAVVGDSVYIGGHFKTIQFGTNTGAAQARYIARFDTQINQWVGLGSGLRWYNDLYTTAYSVIALPSGVDMAGEFDGPGRRLRWDLPVGPAPWALPT